MLGLGDRITVYKANMIIPQIAENLTRSDNLAIPEKCPVCDGETVINQLNGVQTLYCSNEECPAKKIKAFTLFVSRDAMNIDGLSEATLEKFIDRGFIREFVDLFHLKQYKDEIVQMEGFGEKSYQNLMEATQNARHTTLPRLVYALGIANIGVANAKMLCRHFDYDFERLRAADEEELSSIDGIGGIMAASFIAYMRQEDNKRVIDNLLPELELEVPQLDTGIQTLSGKVFVVTGNLVHYASRNELKEIIEQLGGKVTGSVTSKTDCLINNDILSNSSKNKKAKELNIPIITEDDFRREYLEVKE